VKFRPTVSKEQYTLSAVQRAWPSGEWVTEPGSRNPDREGTSGSPKAPGQFGDSQNRADKRLTGDSSEQERILPPSLTIIGGTKYDEDALRAFIAERAPSLIEAGCGRGAEAQAIEIGKELGSMTNWFHYPRPELYGKRARIVNVDDVLNNTSGTVLLVGGGERVKQAKDWLKRTRSKREVIELP
jgi:hypothetical protein